MVIPISTTRRRSPLKGYRKILRKHPPWAAMIKPWGWVVDVLDPNFLPMSPHCFVNGSLCEDVPFPPPNFSLTPIMASASSAELT